MADGARRRDEGGAKDRRSRRDLLAGAAGALGVVTAESLSRIPAAEATQGRALIAGQDNTETSTTAITNTADVDGLVVQGGVQSANGDTHTGVLGRGGSPSGHGLRGEGAGDGFGVLGIAGAYSVGVVGQGGSSVPYANGYGVLGVGGLESPGVRGDGGQSNGAGVEGKGAGSGPGVWGHGVGGPGVLGEGFDSSNGDGVLGKGGGGQGRGVVGLGGSVNGVGVQGIGGGTGPAVRGDGASGDGVFGVASAPSTSGVHGFATSPSGLGVLAENSGDGTALKVIGPSEFSRSGTAVIASPAKSATVTGVALTAQSLILATVQNSVGRWVAAAVPDVAGSLLTISLNKAPPTGKTAKVAWFVVN